MGGIQNVMNNFERNFLVGSRGLTRRKRVDSDNPSTDVGHHVLAKRLNVIDLVGIGVGSTLGAGVYILIGSVAKDQTGPALSVAFLIAGIAAALSAFCYAELSCRCPSAGSAYHYSYICIGEGVAWIIGWALVLEYAIGGSVVARGVTPNLALYFGGESNLPAFLARHTIFGIVVDPPAAILVIIATALLCFGIKESTVAQTTVTAINVCALSFVIVAGGYLASKNGWVGYKLSNGYFPFGINGVLSGSATLFFSYIGFDSVTATAEEVKNPKQQLPWGIGISLFLSCVLYMLLSTIIVGLVPYYELDTDTPISSAFSVYGIGWAAFITTTGAVMALLATLMGSLLPQSRILMAMARDGLLPSFFSDVNIRTHVPVNGTIVTGILAAGLAFVMEVSKLAGMVSVGTLLAFTAVAVSVLIIRYVPPDMVPFQSSAGERSSVFREHRHNMQEVDEDFQGFDDRRGLLDEMAQGYETSALEDMSSDKQKRQQRRKLAKWFISAICVGVLVLASSAYNESFHSSVQITLCGIGSVIFFGGIAGLAYVGEDGAAVRFGRSGGFICPCVPYLPAFSILINTYLLISLGFGTWCRVSIWLAMGVFVYVIYGRTNSSLLGATYVHTSDAEDT